MGVISRTLSKVRMPSEHRSPLRFSLRGPTLSRVSPHPSLGGQSSLTPVRRRRTPLPHPLEASALAALATLKVKGRAPKTGYDRALFGQAWADVDRNGCDTRNDVLRRDLTAYVLKTGTHGCLVLSGTLHDPYTGTTIAFVRGQSTSAKVQIDHVVALSDAWQKGAQQWSTSRRTAYANDSAQPARRRRAHQRAQGRRRCGHLAATQQGLPLLVCRAAGRREGEVRAVGHQRRARRPCADPGDVPVTDPADHHPIRPGRSSIARGSRTLQRQ